MCGAPRRTTSSRNRHPSIPPPFAVPVSVYLRWLTSASGRRHCPDPRRRTSLWLGQSSAATQPMRWRLAIDAGRQGDARLRWYRHEGDGRARPPWERDFGRRLRPRGGENSFSFCPPPLSAAHRWIIDVALTFPMTGFVCGWKEITGIRRVCPPRFHAVLYTHTHTYHLAMQDGVFEIRSYVKREERNRKLFKCKWLFLINISEKMP